MPIRPRTENFSLSATPRWSYPHKPVPIRGKDRIMDLHQLRCFVSVARHNGFRRGAADLHIAQPAVSRHIRRLEAEIGQELFYRLSRGVALTEAEIGRAHV